MEDEKDLVGCCPNGGTMFVEVGPFEEHWNKIVEHQQHFFVDNNNVQPSGQIWQMKSTEQ